MTSNKKSCLVILLISGKYRRYIIVMFSKTLQKAAGIEIEPEANYFSTHCHWVRVSILYGCMYIHSVYMALFGSLYFQVN